MYKSIYFFLSFLFFFSACKEEKYIGALADWPGIKNGLLRAYSDTGVLIEEATYDNDTLHGKRVLYYPEGGKHIVEQYVKGKFHGQYFTFFPDGKIYVEGEYMENAMSGIWKTYYTSGQLKEEVTFKDNLENGPFKEYHENGKFKAKGNYKDGDKEEGLLLLYDITGSLIRKMECSKGICHTIWKKEDADQE